MTSYQDAAKERLNADYSGYLQNKFGAIHYIAWADCHKYMLENCNDYELEYVINGDSDVFISGNGGSVKTRVKANGKWIPCTAAIEDNKSRQQIPLDKITPELVRNTQQRCLAKNISMHGFALDLWAKHDESIPDLSLKDLKSFKVKIKQLVVKNYKKGKESDEVCERLRPVFDLLQDIISKSEVNE